MSSSVNCIGPHRLPWWVCLSFHWSWKILYSKYPMATLDHAHWSQLFNIVQQIQSRQTHTQAGVLVIQNSEVPNKRVIFSPASLAWACWEKCNMLISNFRVRTTFIWVHQGPTGIVLVFFWFSGILKYGVKTQFCQSSWSLVDPNKDCSSSEGSTG